MVTNREAFAQVISFYKKRQVELQGRYDAIYSEISEIEQQMGECDTMLEKLTDDERLASEKGPFSGFASTPQAIRVLLSQVGRADLDTIIRQLLEGGFKTESSDFRHVVRVALRRMRDKETARLHEDGRWGLLMTDDEATELHVAAREHGVGG